MGAVVDFVGDVVGGAVDIVGDVVEGAVDIAGDVVKAVADNPLMLAAAIAAPYALSAMAATAGASASLGGISLAGATTGTGLSFAPALGAGIGSAGITSAGLAAGSTMGISFGAIQAAAAGTALGASAMTSSFNFAGIDEATNYGKSILETSNSSQASWSLDQTAASNVLGNSPAQSFYSANLDPTVLTQAKDAVSLVNQGFPYSEAVSTATSNTVTVPSSWDMFTSAAKDFGNSITNLNTNTQSLFDQIGQTIAPNADPALQRFISNTAVNTTVNGGDVEEALKSSLIGAGAGMAGKEITGLTADSLGSTGSRIAGNAAAGATGNILSGGDIGSALIGSGVGAIGAGTTNLTGNPLIGGAAATTAGALAGDRDVGTSLLNYGINAGVNTGMNMANNALGLNKLDPNSILGQITNNTTGNLSSMIKQSVMPSNRKTSNLSPLSAASAQKLLQAPKSSVTTPSLAPIVKPTLPAGTPIPAKKVDVATLTPIGNISGLTGIVTKQ